MSVVGDGSNDPVGGHGRDLKTLEEGDDTIFYDPERPEAWFGIDTDALVDVGGRV